MLSWHDTHDGLVSLFFKVPNEKCLALVKISCKYKYYGDCELIH